MSFEWKMFISRVDSARLITIFEIWKQTRNCLVVSKLKFVRQFSYSLPFYRILRLFCLVSSSSSFNFNLKNRFDALERMLNVLRSWIILPFINVVELLNDVSNIIAVHQILYASLKTESNAVKRLFKLKVRQLRSYLCANNFHFLLRFVYYWKWGRFPLPNRTWIE